MNITDILDIAKKKSETALKIFRNSSPVHFSGQMDRSIRHSYKNNIIMTINSGINGAGILKKIRPACPRHI